MGEKGTIMLALAMVSMSIAFSIAVITWKSNVAGNMMVPSFNLRNQTMLSTQTSAPLRQSSSTYKSCIGRLESCEGSFEFNTGHIKSRTDAFHLPDETRDYFLHVTDEESKHGVLQCINQLNATALAEYDRNYRWGHGGGERFPAKIYEELLIYYHLFPQITRFVNPYFIELGGHDGVTESNTLALEFCANWNGLLIEGNSRIYTQLMDNRPQMSKMLLAPSCKFDNGTVEFVAMANTKSTMSGLRGVVEGNREGTLFDSTHCGPLHLYLNDIGIDRVQYFSLDVEGSENAVLETVDFDAVTIDIWEIESWNRMCHQDCPKRDAFRRLMTQQQGYNLVMSMQSRDDVFVHPRSDLCRFILDRFQQLQNKPQTDDSELSFSDAYLLQHQNVIVPICSFKYSILQRESVNNAEEVVPHFLTWVNTIN